MKLLKLIFLLPVIVIFAMMSGAPFGACTKNVDTVYIKHDTTIYVHDTTKVVDSIYDFTSGLVAYYNFNGGNLNDSSGFHNNIVFNNATLTKDRYGRDNNAYLFNGSSSYMQVKSSASLNPDNITLYAIVKVNGFYHGTSHGNFILVRYWDQAYGMYDLYFTDFINAYGQPDTLHEVFAAAYGDNPDNAGNAAGVNSGTTYVGTGTWYKLAYTYDGITAKLYVNGTLVSSLVRTAVFTDNPNDLFIGRNNDPYGLFPFWFNGVMDEIRIYNRALPPQALTQLMNSTN